MTELHQNLPLPTQSRQASPRAAPAYDRAGNEAVRHELLRHESAIKSVGSLFYFGAVGGLGAAIMFFLWDSEAAGAEPVSFAVKVAGALLLLGLATMYGWVGRSVRQLKDTGRYAASVLAAIGLINVPIGTLIGAYILYLLHSEKGKRVFSDEYRSIVEATPHIKYKSKAMMLLLVIVVSLVLVFAVMAVMEATR